jgi:hypothetical protein
MTTLPRIRSGRKPKLSVVGGESVQPLYAIFNTSLDRCSLLTFWTEQQWADMHEVERPEHASWIPGVGYAIHQMVSTEGAEHYVEVRDAQRERHRAMIALNCGRRKRARI